MSLFITPARHVPQGLPLQGRPSGTDRVDVLQHKFIYDVNTHWFCHSFGHQHFMGLVGLFWVEQYQSTSRVWAPDKATLIVSQSYLPLVI